MTIPDFINGGFELCAGIAQALNCLKLAKDKKVAGIHWQVTTFFSAWGAWNLYYYPHLHQMLSFTGGLVLFTFNTLWFSMYLWFSHCSDT